MDNIRQMISSISSVFRAAPSDGLPFARCCTKVYTNSIKNKWHFVLQIALVFLPLNAFPDCVMNFVNGVYHITCSGFGEGDDDPSDTNTVGVVDCESLKDQIIDIYSNETQNVDTYLDSSLSSLLSSFPLLGSSSISIPVSFYCPQFVNTFSFIKSTGSSFEYYYDAVNGGANGQTYLSISSDGTSATLYVNGSPAASASGDDFLSASSINLGNYSFQNYGGWFGGGGTDSTSISNNLISATNNIIKSKLILSSQSQNFTDQVRSLPCRECSDSEGDGSGSCCGTDMTPIVDRLNMLLYYQSSISNNVEQIKRNTITANLLLSSISNSVSAFNNDWLRGFFAESDINWGPYSPGDWSENIIQVQGHYVLYAPRSGPVNKPLFQKYNENADFVSIVNFLGERLPNMVASLNNYEYIKYLTLTNTTNWSHAAVSLVTNSLTQVTNSLGVLSSVVIQKSPIDEYNPANNASLGETYHAFLTNYYIQVSTGQASGTRTHTNYFDRIEMLLASLVFNDEKGIDTNDVSSLYSQISSNQSSLETSVTTTLENSRNLMVSRLSKLNNVGGSVVDILSTFNSTFSNLTIPSSVNLMAVTVDNSNLQIRFGSEELGVLPQILRAATSCAVYFVGLLLLWRFLKWVVKNLWWEIKFIYLFISAAFHKS